MGIICDIFDQEGMRYFQNHKGKISNEAKLIFCCARTTMDNETRCRVKKLLLQPIDWNMLIERSVFHGVAPLIYSNLNKVNSNEKIIPQKIILRLRDYYYRTLVDNLQSWMEFQRILNVLDQTKVKLVPIKGIVIADTLYHNIGLRPMVDIDLLIQEDGLSTFEKTILKLGYRKDLGGRSGNHWRKYYHHFVFKRTNSTSLYLQLEIHWNLDFHMPNKIFFPKLWERVKEETVDGIRMFMLSPEDTLLCLALHLRRHTRSLTLRHICDISELLKQYENNLDWNYIVEEAEKNRIKSVLYFALFSASKLLDVSAPTNILEKIKPSLFKCKWINASVNKNTFFYNKFKREELLKIKYFLLRFSLFDKTRDFFSYILFSPIEDRIQFWLRKLSLIKC